MRAGGRVGDPLELVGLGATQVNRWQECRVLRVPGGHLVCVLPRESTPEIFDAQARTWP